jgi:hypothetical protein
MEPRQKKRTLKLNFRRDLNNSLEVTTMALQHHHNCKKKNLWEKKEEKGSSWPTWFGVPCKSKNMVACP